MSLETNIKKKAMLKALEDALGVVTMACRTVGIDRTTHYDWLKDDEAYRMAVADLKEVALDFAESKLHQSIRNGSDTATIFFLKTQGKKRGYIEKTELENSGETIIRVRYDERKSNNTEPTAQNTAESIE